MNILCSLFCCSSAKKLCLFVSKRKRERKNARRNYDSWARKSKLPWRTWTQQKLNVCKQDWSELGVDVPQRGNEVWEGWDKEDEAQVFWQRVIQEVDEREREKGRCWQNDSDGADLESWANIIWLALRNILSFCLLYSSLMERNIVKETCTDVCAHTNAVIAINESINKFRLIGLRRRVSWLSVKIWFIW